VLEEAREKNLTVEELCRKYGSHQSVYYCGGWLVTGKRARRVCGASPALKSPAQEPPP
jgi:hypothetical protein